MAKGYVVAHIKVHDPEGFKTFAEMAGPVIKEFGGTILVRDPKPELREGEIAGVCVIVEFDSPEQASSSRIRRLPPQKSFAKNLGCAPDARERTLRIFEKTAQGSLKMRS